MGFDVVESSALISNLEMSGINDGSFLRIELAHLFSSPELASPSSVSGLWFRFFADFFPTAAAEG